MIKLTRLHIAGFTLPATALRDSFICQRNEGPNDSPVYTFVGFNEGGEHVCDIEWPKDVSDAEIRKILDLQNWELDWAGCGCESLFQCCLEVDAWIPSKLYHGFPATSFCDLITTKPI